MTNFFFPSTFFSLVDYTTQFKLEMATHSSVLAWRIPGTEEPGGLLSMGSRRVGHNGCDLAAAAAGNISQNYFILESREIIYLYIAK